MNNSTIEQIDPKYASIPNIDKLMDVISNSKKEEPNFDKVTNIFSPQIQIFEPFGAHVDPSRSNMSSKQILQVVTSRMNDTPFILNKAFKDFTEIKSPYFLRAPSDGIILSNKFDMLFILYHEPTGDRMVFEYIPQLKKIQAHALNLRFMKEPGAFKAGELLFDYTGQSEEGLPKIGYRTKVLFGSFLGYTAEDAMVISESFARRAQVDYHEKLYIPITKKLKYIPYYNDKENDVLKYFYRKGECQGKNFLSYIKIDPNISYDSQMVNVNEENSRYYVKHIEGLEGAEIRDFKLHRISKDSFAKAAKDYVYSPKIIQELSEIYGEKFREYSSIIEEYKSLVSANIDITNLVNQLYVSYFSSSKLPSKLLNEVAEKFGILDKDIDYLLEIDICQTIPTVLGDKFANCFAGKGTISLIVPDHLMPLGVDLIFNPLGIYGRNNWGSIFELGLSKIIKDIEGSIDNHILTKDKIKLVNELFVHRTDREYYIQIEELLASWDCDPENFLEFVRNVNKNGMYINVDPFPNFPYKEFYDDFISEYDKVYNIGVNKEPFIFTKELQEWVHNTRAYNLNGLEGFEDIETEAFIGDSYYLKLFHTSNSKYNSVAIAKTYNRANGQPAKGRKKNGGQHTSWMTVAADLGHSDNSYIMKELGTIKSDCISNKDQFFLDKTYTGHYSMKSGGYDSKTNDMLNHNLAATFGMKLVHTGEAVETSRATEVERIQNKIADEDITINPSDFKKNVDIIFNDFEMNDLNLENILKEKDEDYFDEVEAKIH